MKFLNTLKVAILAMIAALAVTALPAMAQTAPSTTTTCTTGCPATVTVSGIAAFGGLVVGGYGSIDTQGNLVPGSNITGTVTGSNTGGGDTNVAVDFHGCVTITCGSTTIDASVSAFERGQMTVTATSSAPGQMVALANSGTLAAGASFAVAFNPGSTTTTTH